MLSTSKTISIEASIAKLCEARSTGKAEEPLAANDSLDRLSDIRSSYA